MKARYRLENVQDVKATLILTMTVKEWAELEAAVEDKWPGWKFRSLITDLIWKANKEFMGDSEAA